LPVALGVAAEVLVASAVDPAFAMAAGAATVAAAPAVTVEVVASITGAIVVAMILVVTTELVTGAVVVVAVIVAVDAAAVADVRAASERPISTGMTRGPNAGLSPADPDAETAAVGNGVASDAEVSDAVAASAFPSKFAVTNSLDAHPEMEPSLDWIATHSPSSLAPTMSTSTPGSSLATMSKSVPGPERTLRRVSSVLTTPVCGSSASAARATNPSKDAIATNATIATIAPSTAIKRAKR
jgi:hypothetical protein